MILNTVVDFFKIATKNLRVENKLSFPTLVSTDSGFLLYHSGQKKFYGWDGTGWLGFGGSSVGVLTGKVSLSSAQLLSIFTSPVEIIAAPGAGKVINILRVTYNYKFITAAYTANTLTVHYTSGGLFHSDSILGEGADVIHSALIGTGRVMYENEAIIATSSGLDPTLGSGTVDVLFTYEIQTL